MDNRKKHDYKKICKERGLEYIREENPYIYFKDAMGFEHKMIREKFVKGGSQTIQSLADKSLKKEYFLHTVSTKHHDIFDKSSFEKFKYERSDMYTVATCHKHGDYKTKPQWLLSGGHHCMKCKAERSRITTEEFIKRSKGHHGDRYDYSKTVYQTTKEPVTITCKIHGDFEIIANYHLGNKRGCQKCGLESSRLYVDTEEFIKRAKRYHGNRYDYSKTIYQGCRKPVTITCKIHGDFEVIANNHSGNKSGCQKCGMENGGYSRTDYKNTCPDGSHVYVMRLFNEVEDFVKIGISKSPDARSREIQRLSGYDTEVTHQEFYKDAGVAWDVELMLHREFKANSYSPNIGFAGQTECFDLSIKDEAIKLLQCVA